MDAPLLDTPTNDDVPRDVSTIIAPLSSHHTHTIIFLHGREDFGEDLAKYFFDSKASDGRSLAEIFPSVKWVFPTAKLRYSAQRDFEFSSSSFAELLKGEEIISQWFDVWDINTPDEKQELMIPGLQESIQEIVGIIREEAETIPLDRIVLGGISQGCATAIYTLLSSGLKLGGFIGLSSWLPFQNIVEALPQGPDTNNDEISQQIQAILPIPEDKSATEDAIIISRRYVSVPERQTRDANDLETMLSTLNICQQPMLKTPVFLAHSKDDEVRLLGGCHIHSPTILRVLEISFPSLSGSLMSGQ